MNYLKKLGSCYLIMVPFLLICLLLTTVLSYFDIISNNILKILKLLIPILTVFIGAFKISKNSSKQGYLQGLYLGLSYIFLMFILNLIFFRSFTLKLLISYIIILLVSVVGGMIGITKKVQSND